MSYSHDCPECGERFALDRGKIPHHTRTAYGVERAAGPTAPCEGSGHPALSAAQIATAVKRLRAAALQLDDSDLLGCGDKQAAVREMRGVSNLLDGIEL